MNRGALSAQYSLAFFNAHFHLVRPPFILGKKPGEFVDVHGKNYGTRSRVRRAPVSKLCVWVELEILRPVMGGYLTRVGQYYFTSALQHDTTVQKAGITDVPPGE